jgi:hypothetical protein
VATAGGDLRECGQAWPAMRTGSWLDARVPSPNCARELSPQHHVCPALSMPQVCQPPVAIRAKRCAPATAPGVAWSATLALARPMWPAAPQQAAAPPASSAQGRSPWFGSPEVCIVAAPTRSLAAIEQACR